jgi:hypothetical protein
LGGFPRQNYLFAQFLYRFSDYTNVSLGCLASFDDTSFTPILGAAHELFQGMNLDLSCRFSPGADEGSRFQMTLKARLRF